MSDQGELKARVAMITERLEQNQRIRNWKGRADPLNELILTVLSQSTTDNNRDMGFSRLRAKYPTWEAVLAAGPGKVAEQIRPAGLANQKSKRIVDILQWIKDTWGELNIDFLYDMPVKEAVELFTSRKGIGIKTIAVTLMFACGRDIFPVDTHVHRICKRLSLVPESADAVKTFSLMTPLVPHNKCYSLHMNMLDFGRTICKARSPKCNICLFNNICLSTHIIK